MSDLTALRLCLSQAASEGFGHDSRIHSADFFELADQPQEVLMTVTKDELKRLFEVIERAGIHVFYGKTEVAFGVPGKTKPQ